MPRANTIGRLTVLFLMLGPGCALKGKKTEKADPAPAPVSVGSTQTPASTAAVGSSDKSAASTTPEKMAELNRMMAELQSIGALDPQAQSQLMTDLQQTDPSLWPQVVQAFRASLAYRQRANAGKAPPPMGPAAPDPATSPDIVPIATSGALPGETRASAPAAAIVAIKAMEASADATAESAEAKETSAPGEVRTVAHEEPIAEEGEWNQQVAEAIHSLEAAQTNKKSLGTSEQVYLRMLYLAAGRRDDALRPVPGLPPSEQDFWSEQLFGMSTYLDASRSPDARRRAAEAHLHLTKATGRLAEAGDLVVRNLAFCTEVHSYGMYTAFPKNEFRPGQQVLLYAEVENFKTEPSPKGFHTALKSSYQILDPQGKRVMEHDLGATEEYCQNARRDYFIRYFLSVPNRIYDGTYKLQLTIEDKLAGKIGQATIEFTAKEKKQLPVPRSQFDAIVVGTGGIGSAALAELAGRGARVLGIDRFPPGHDRGSSHGQTRIIRQAYFEHPDYVPLLLRTYDLWHDLERRSGEQLFHQVGLLQIGPASGVVIAGVLASAQLHGLDVERLTPEDVNERFPGLRVHPWTAGVFERGAGYLRVEACVKALAQSALDRGATIRVGETVRGWRADPHSVEVETEGGTYTAGALIITVGAWASQLLADLRLPLEVRRKPQYWYATATDDYLPERGFPAFLFETPAGMYYGFPQLGPEGVKVAEHTGGRLVTDPLTVDRDIDREDQARVEAFLSEYLPGVKLACTRHAACMYTLTPDHHFVVDRHPEHERVVFAAGLSGHGFKFAPVLGEVLADLALGGRTLLPIEFLSRSRPALDLPG